LLNTHKKLISQINQVIFSILTHSIYLKLAIKMDFLLLKWLVMA